MNYELKITQTNNKAGKYHYQVIDENGVVISERKSNREYVACTVNGGMYFGRLDLIGKGEHGRFTKYFLEQSVITPETFAKRYAGTTYVYENVKADGLKSYNAITTIAYLKTK